MNYQALRIAVRRTLPFVGTVLAVGCSPDALAQAPVFDAANVTQTTVTAMENIRQTALQIQQYKSQLQQYENMLRNTAAPNAHIWDQAQATIVALRTSIDTLNYYKQTLGSIDQYLEQFRNTTDYQRTPCFTAAGCTPAQRDALRETDRLGSEAQKRANDALFRGLDRQQDALVADARQLERLQGAAQGAEGQMQAIGYANQLASQHANQLLQIRALLIAQQNVLATRNQVVADREAREAAASSQLRAGAFRPSSRRVW